MAASRRRPGRVVVLACLAMLLAAAGVWWSAGEDDRTVTAYFSSAVAVFPDNDVRILGVPVGRVTALEPQGPVVKVVMEIDGTVPVPAQASAVIVAPSLVSGRHIQLAPAYTGGPAMPDGGVIPLERTVVPLGVDELVRAADELATMLGPHGADREGALSELLDVGAANLVGNGQALNDTIGNLAQLSQTLAGSREDLFGTITELQSFTSAVQANDPQVRQFTTQLAEVSDFLAEDREELGAALRELSVALAEVAAFVQDNRAVLESNVDRLTEVTEVLVSQRGALAEILDTAPTALNNVHNAYDAHSGTLATRANLEELRSPPILLVCELIRRGTPAAFPDVSAQTCRQLEPWLSGAVPVPPPAEVISALQAGQPPPLPMLAVPTVPAVPGGR